MDSKDIEKLKRIKAELNELVDKYDKEGRIDIGDLLEDAQLSIRRSIIKINT